VASKRSAVPSRGRPSASTTSSWVESQVVAANTNTTSISPATTATDRRVNVRISAARGESGAGIRPPLHPASHRYFSLKYRRIFSVVVPCDPGASPPSVRRHPFHHGLLPSVAGSRNE
jgi:hypothetical protein